MHAASLASSQGESCASCFLTGGLDPLFLSTASRKKNGHEALHFSRDSGPPAENKKKKTKNTKNQKKTPKIKKNIKT
jgi:hypothetical protein